MVQKKLLTMVAMIIASSSIANPSHEIKVVNHSAMGFLIVSEDGSEVLVKPYANVYRDFGSNTVVKAIAVSDKRLLCTWSLNHNNRYPVVRLDFTLDSNKTPNCSVIIQK